MYDHRAVHGGWYPEAGYQHDLQWYTGNPGWNPGYTGYGVEGVEGDGAGAGNGAGAGAGAGAPAPTGQEVGAILSGFGDLVSGILSGGAQISAAETLAANAGVPGGLSSSQQTEITDLIALYNQGVQQTNQGNAGGVATQQAAQADIAAILLAAQNQNQGMSPGLIVGLALGGVALLGGVVFLASRGGRGAHYPYHF